MADEQLVALFASSETPDPDPQFVHRVSRAIARERRTRRLVEFGTGGAAAAALFLMAPLVGGVVAQLAKSPSSLVNQPLLFIGLAAVAAGWGLFRAYA